MKVTQDDTGELRSNLGMRLRGRCPCLVDEGDGRVAEAQDAIRLLVENLASLPRLAAEHHRHLRQACDMAIQIENRG